MDHGNACGPLQCIAVHYGALQCIVETLQKPCRPLERFQMIAVHYDALRASSACCGGVHHTFTETPKFHLPPLSSG